MVDFNHIAIADTLRHPKWGVISHQPDLVIISGGLIREFQIL